MHIPSLLVNKMDAKQREREELAGLGLGSEGSSVFTSSCFAGDEDVEEGEGQNENSGDSDEVPPKVCTM